ncbi:hypothetical protein SteCoe_23364 [Stentor coeruleus]|uniref:V-SNARE coiled-coil homology domain-containing protein n=1 Tax=Stentor coeruleus TaxID=5963 RepID=A0A1R2BK06_9CILI|nr:hypothetical protein SteCoe_23364 [Stentor coeruleus]
MASILYSIVASDTSSTPLAEASLAEGNFNLLALKLLTKVRKNSSVSYVYENKYIFHYNNEFGLTFMCMTDAAFHNRTAYAFLFDIKEKFIEKYGENAKDMQGFSANREFGNVLKGKMHFYNSDSDSEDKLKIVKENIMKTKDVMIENIDKVLARGEKIELLVNKTQQLSDSAVKMKNTASKVKRFMWWQNKKLTALLIFIIIIILYFIITFSCGGFSFPNC